MDIKSTLQNLEAVSALHCGDVKYCTQCKGTHGSWALPNGMFSPRVWNLGMSPISLLYSFQWDLVTSLPEGKCYHAIWFTCEVPSIAKCWDFFFFFLFGWIVCRYLNFMKFPKILVDNSFFPSKWFEMFLCSYCVF